MILPGALKIQDSLTYCIFVFRVVVVVFAVGLSRNMNQRSLYRHTLSFLQVYLANNTNIV